MERHELKNRLEKLELVHKIALALRAAVIIKLDSQTPFSLHRGKLNLTDLAHLIGASRQIFYPHRGSVDAIAILEELNRHSEHLIQVNNKSLSRSKETQRQREEIRYLQEENKCLKSDLRVQYKTMELIHLSSIIIL
jgi:hypothetical protein